MEIGDGYMYQALYTRQTAALSIKFRGGQQTRSTRDDEVEILCLYRFSSP